MDKIIPLASTCRVATPHDAVNNSECAYTFHSPYTTDDKGIVVNLSTFVGTVESLALSGDPDDPERALFVRIVKRRVERMNTDENDGEGNAAEKEEEKAKAEVVTKLGVGVEGGFASEDDKFETLSTHSIVLLRKKGAGEGGGCEVLADVPYSDATRDSFPTQVAMSADSIIHHAGSAVQQDLKAWELDDEPKPVSKYADGLPFVDNGVKISPDPGQWKCEKSGDTENLWLNLSDGYVGGGRRNWDGSGGSNGALDHFEETGRKFPLVVKLGTITTDIETADCYSYAPDEDGPVKIPKLAEMLEKRGIKVASLQKTVKTTAELEVELNATYAFDAITESGASLVPVSGPGLQGLQNLGNSCYVNSVVQMLFGGTVPELSSRYGLEAGGDVTSHPLLRGVSPKGAALDLLCQTAKLGCALTSGAFAGPVPDSAVVADASSPSSDPKYRLAPRMFKHCVGRDHPDFRTNRQQDAPQFLQYLLEKLDRAEMGAGAARLPRGKGDGASSSSAAVPLSSGLFSYRTTNRIVCGADGKVKYKDGAPDTVLALRIPMEKAVVKKESSMEEDGGSAPEQKRQKSEEGEDEKEEKEKEEVPTLSLRDCLDSWSAPHDLDGLRWPHLGNTVRPATQETRFHNFPRYLIVQIQRYELGPDWTPRKLEVNVNVPLEIDLNGLKFEGPRDGEDLVPEEEEGTDAGGAPSSVAAAAAAAPSQPNIDEGALAQLMDMGFSMNGCKRALTKVGGSDVEAAMNWIFEHNTDPDFNDPLPKEAGSGRGTAKQGDSGVDEGVVMSLVESLGCFTADQVRAALRTTDGAADRAADWLFSHMDDLDGAIAALESKSGSAEGGQSTSAAAAAAAPLEDGDGRYSLVGLVSHIGKNTGSGHYVAHLKKKDKDGDGESKWVIFNDEKVALSETPPFRHAYLYLFQRKDSVGAPNTNY